MKSKLKTLAGKFRNARVAVLGDMVADIYVSGMPTRISREAPVLIIRQEEEWLVPGSAANAAANVLALGASVFPIGVVGDDEQGAALKHFFKSRKADVSGLITVKGGRTTSKMRILAGDLHTSKQQVVRLDREFSEVSDKTKKKIIDTVEKLADKVDAFLVSDYGYGVVSSEVSSRLGMMAVDGKIILGDSRYALGRFKGFTAVVPNEDEASLYAGLDISDDHVMKKAGASMMRNNNWKALIVTCGNKGMTVFDGKKKPVNIPIAGSSDIVDVSGAGDTVAANIVLGLVSGGSFLEAARLATYGASVVVMKRGTATLSIAELKKAIG